MKKIGRIISGPNACVQYCANDVAFLTLKAEVTKITENIRAIAEMQCTPTAHIVNQYIMQYN